jgi:hypothetical protein
MNILEKMVSGLHGYEIIMLFLGVIMFIVILGLLVFFAAQRRQIYGLFPFFALPIIMIGYPGIQQFKVAGNEITLRDELKNLAQRPDDPSAQEKVREALGKLEERPVRDPGTLVTIAEAQVAVGDTTKALKTLDSALSAHPDSQPVLRSKEKLQAQISIREDLSKLKANPHDRAIRQQLINHVAVVEKSAQLNTSQMIQMASAKAALGDTTTAMQLVESALDRSPTSPRAVQLQNRLKQNTSTTFRRQ